jgi:hypothetical protein
MPLRSWYIRIATGGQVYITRFCTEKGMREALPMIEAEWAGHVYILEAGLVTMIPALTRVCTTRREQGQRCHSTT